MEVRAKS